MSVVPGLNILKIDSVGLKKKVTTKDFPDTADDDDLEARLTVYELVYSLQACTQLFKKYKIKAYNQCGSTCSPFEASTLTHSSY